MLGVPQIENTNCKMILTGKTLGDRQKVLNDKVNKAVAENANFNAYKKDSNSNDVDFFFKIDLAAQNRNIDFALEILKGGDAVHIGRALNKCTWLGDDDYAKIIDINNLHNNIFPLMSIKMKKKLLCVLARRVRNENRASSFYEYCVKLKLFNIALKFLLNTPESYKRDVISQKSKVFNLLSDRDENLVNFIAESFILAHTYLDTLGPNWAAVRNNALYLLRHLYSVSNEQYLKLVEKYYEPIESRYNKCNRFGGRLSKEILKKHKDRVLMNPKLYVSVLNKNKISRNSTISDVKVYSVALLPEDVTTFWSSNYYETYKFLLKLIPANERFSFIKEIFLKTYPNTTFEMNIEYYSNKFYEMMTSEEREDWALRHILRGEEILGGGNDYIWYKFVSFEKALPVIKKFIEITPDNEKRADIVSILIDSAKTQNELATLLDYYYNRHINEPTNFKARFVDKLIERHQVFSFNEKCWAVLEKIFHSLDVFNLSKRSANGDYRVIALIYYIVQKKKVPSVLNDYLEKGNISVFDLKGKSHELGPEKEDMVYEYLLKFYSSKVEAMDRQYENDADDGIIDSKYINYCLNLLYRYSRTKDDIPEIIYKYIKLDWDKYKNNYLFENDPTDKLTEKHIMRYMKTDSTLVVKEFPKIKEYMENSFEGTNWLYRKLKIYFNHDIAQKYVLLLNDCFSADDVHYRLIKVAVYGIFKLAEEAFKIDFLAKHVPSKPKIDHGNVSQKCLYIQEAICAYVCVSRPPLPMSSVLQYVTGDYVHHCLPLFNCFLVNLPLPVCISFVETLINKPVSIQKHGLRLAFDCFNSENLKNLINSIWKRTKNVSLRKILFKSLLDKVLKEDGQAQIDLFEVLKTLTLDLHQDDDNELFSLLKCREMPTHLMGAYLVCGWKAVSKLPEKSINFERMATVITAMEENFKLVPDEELFLITNQHVSKMLDNKEILKTNINEELEELIKAKWELVIQYLSNVYNEDQLKKISELIRHIIKTCIEMWSEIRNKKYIIREFCTLFIRDLENNSYQHHTEMSFPYMKVIFDSILSDLRKSLPERDIFLLSVRLRLSDITRDIIIAGKKLQNDHDRDEVAAAVKTCVLRFAEDFGNFVKASINTRQYFSSFFEQIDEHIKMQLNRLDLQLNAYSIVKLNTNDLLVIMCYGLLKFKMSEIFLQILRLLPLDYNGTYDTYYYDIINEVKDYKNKEVQYFMMQKFVNSDFICRKELF